MSFVAIIETDRFIAHGIAYWDVYVMHFHGLISANVAPVMCSAKLRGVTPTRVVAQTMLAHGVLWCAGNRLLASLYVISVQHPPGLQGHHHPLARIPPIVSIAPTCCRRQIQHVTPLSLRTVQQRIECAVKAVFTTSVTTADEATHNDPPMHGLDPSRLPTDPRY